ncbi:MAG TPA: glycosyltransferase family 1 protein, partial [Oligoflexia bacterium]|nr:glycosyltransferase family 1 protein [Oligoflexia bacterium]
LAISEARKQDVVNLLGVEPDRIFVTPLAVSENFAARDLSPGNWREEAAQKRRLLALPVENPILLYVGGIDPRKNVPFLLRVFAEVLRVWPHRNRPLLVLVGKHENDDQLPQLLKEAERLEITANLRRPGFVPDELLRSYYQCADAVVFPSLYEGFGLPVLEAMACGVPVVAGKNSSIPEVAGIDSAILCEDGNISEWVSAVSALLADPSKQLDLSRRGVRQARRYSWMNTACLTVEAYRCLLPKGSAKSTHVLPGAI